MSDIKKASVGKRNMIVKIIFMILRIITLGFFKPKPVVPVVPPTGTP